MISFTVQIMLGGAGVLLLGAVAAWLLRETEVRWLRMELGIANDQLRHAVFAGAIVPPREAVMPRTEPRAPDINNDVPDFLQLFIDRYESDEGKAAARGEIFSMRRRGMKDDAIWIQLQRQYPDLQ